LAGARIILQQEPGFGRNTPFCDAEQHVNSEALLARQRPHIGNEGRNQLVETARQ